MFHDPLTALLAEAVRERGAHAVWYVEVAARREDAIAGEARLFLREYTSPVDAYLMTWHGPAERGLRVERIAAMIPSHDIVAARDIHASPGAAERCEHVGWSSVLADVVEAGRDENVGGTLHARPAVAPR